MTLQYQPNKGFSINSIPFEWGEPRNSVRTKLQNQHREDDRVIELAQYFDGDESRNIHQRRDIFENINQLKNFFSFEYNSNHELKELEVHEGLKIIVDSVELEFNKDIHPFVQALKNMDANHFEIEEGTHLFKNLKLTISNAESNGGEGNGLAYFYVSNDISHLLENH